MKVFQHTSHVECCSVLCLKDEIVELTAFEDFISFDRKGKKKVKRTENHKIKVTIEVDMVCDAV